MCNIPKRRDVQYSEPTCVATSQVSIALDAHPLDRARASCRLEVSSIFTLSQQISSKPTVEFSRDTVRLRPLFSFFCACLLSLAWLLGGCSALEVDAFDRPAGSDPNAPAATLFVPRSAPLAFSLLFDRQRLKAWPEVLPQARKRSRLLEPLKQLQQTLLADSGLDFRDRVQPWLGGEAVLAITSTDFDRDASNGLQPGYLLAAAVSDIQQARQFLDLYWEPQAAAGEKPALETYKGVSLVYQQGSFGRKRPATALAGNYLLAANHPKVLRDALNSAQAKNLSLLGDSGYQAAVARFSKRDFGFLWANFPQAAGLLGNPPEPLFPGASQTYDRFAVALELQPTGVLGKATLLSVPSTQTASVAPSNERRSPAFSKPAEALQYLPEDSFLALNGRDLRGLWQQIAPALEGDSAIASLVNPLLETTRQRWGLDLPADIFQWAAGEYALALAPNPTTEKTDWIYTVRHARESDAAIAHLDEIAEARNLEVSPIALGDRTVSAWTLLSAAIADLGAGERTQLTAEVQGVYTTEAGYDIFSSSIGGLYAALGFPAEKAPPVPAENALLDRQDFAAALQALPAANDGYAYVDWKNGKRVFQKQLPWLRFLELFGQPVLENLRSIALTGEGMEAGNWKVSLFVSLE